MGKPGPAPSPTVVKLREGNPSKEKLTDDVSMPPAYLPEPDWNRIFPVSKVGRKPVEPEREEDESIEHFVHREKIYRRRQEEYEAQVGARRVSENCRKWAQDTWRRSVPILDRAIGLSDVDMDTLLDYCITVARLVVCEQEISREGLVVASNRGGFVKNPLTAVVGQYRAQLKTYIGQLGLSPAARVGLPGKPDGADDDDLFD